MRYPSFHVGTAILAGMAAVFGCSSGDDSPGGADGADVTAVTDTAAPGLCEGLLPASVSGSAGAIHLVSTRCSAAQVGAATQSDSVQQAIDLAGPGDTIFVDEGDWAESLTASVGARIVGSGAGTTVIRPPAGSPGFTLSAAEPIALEGLAIADATGWGVGVSGGTVTLLDVTITGTSQNNGARNGGTGGHGVAADYGATLHVGPGCDIRDSAGIGVVAWRSTLTVSGAQIEDNGAGGIAIVDGAFLGDPLAIVDGAFSPDPQASAVVTDTVVAGNASFGVASYDADLAMDHTEVTGTTATGGGTDGDGVLALGRSGLQPMVRLGADCAVSGSARSGVLVATQPGGEQVAAMRTQIDGQLSGNGLGGAWMQGAGAALELTDTARIHGNQRFGVSATSGSALTIRGARIENTALSTYAPPGGGAPAEIGDGVAITQGASLDIDGVELVDNARAGIVADSPNEGVFIVDGAFITGSEYGIAVQSVPAGAQWTVPSAADPGIEIEASVQDVAIDAGLGVQSDLCAAGSGCIAPVAAP